ncbi:tetratricopeptide repeat protein [Thermodesulfobacteriota bacterium]
MKRLPFPAPQSMLPWLLCLVLAAVTLAVYWPVAGHDFVRFDDHRYVTENEAVRSGLSGASIAWAFTAMHAANWHPLTWLSHMLDCELFGLVPRGHHLMSLFFHLANTLLLFGLLRSMTAAVWRSLLVAALFALHPLHVESVAWVSERKDVLSTFFLLLTLWAYAGYVRRPALKRYLLVAGLFVLGLMTKPMLVTLPCVLLLLDFWPLGRLGSGREAWELVREKTPLFVLSAGSCAVTLIAQHKGEAMQPLDLCPFAVRLANALSATAGYLVKMIWPADLAVFYPLHGMPPLSQVVAAGLVVVLLSALCLAGLKARPYLAVGWLWYLGTLVPVIGLVQVGLQSMADRYSYVPLIGIFIMLAWGAAGPAAKRRGTQIMLSGVALVVLGLFAAGTSRQLDYWADSTALFQRAVDVTENNHVMHYNLGIQLVRAKKIEAGLAQYAEAVRIKPGFAPAHSNMGLELVRSGRIDAGINHYYRAIGHKPDYAVAHYNLGLALEEKGPAATAIRHYVAALAADPGYLNARFRLGQVLLRRGFAGDAAVQLAAARRLDPQHRAVAVELRRAEDRLAKLREQRVALEARLAANPAGLFVRYRLGTLYAQSGRSAAALAEYRQVLSRSDRYAGMLSGLELAEIITGDFALAAEVYTLIAEKDPASSAASYSLACLQARLGNREEALKWLAEALRRGFMDWDELKTDRRLEPVRELAEYKRLLPDSVD